MLSLFMIRSTRQLDIMKRILAISCYINFVFALAVPILEQNSVGFQPQSQVVIGSLLLEARPGTETALTEREDPINEEMSSESCFCSGGTLCCEKNGETDCGFGMCGI